MKKLFELSDVEIHCLPLGLIEYLYPGEAPLFFDSSLPFSVAVTPSDILREAFTDYHHFFLVSAFFDSYSSYLCFLIDFIGGDAPEVSAVFLDELHKQERSSSSLRL